MPNGTTWWLDATTAFIAFDRDGRQPTGIPRVVAETLKAARRNPPPGVILRCTRYDPLLPGLREVSWEDFEATVSRADAPPPRCPGTAQFTKKVVRNVARRLPGDGMGAVLQLRRRGQAVAARLNRLASRFSPGHKMVGPEILNRSGGFHHPFSSGDIWVNLGCWWHERLPEAMAAIRTGGVEVETHVLIHDCIPLIFPEFVPVDIVHEWRRAIRDLLAGTRVYITCSENTQRDVSELMHGGDANRAGLRRIRLGDVFLSEGQTDEEDAAIRSRLGLNDPYVLMVGTIEPRKNHALVLRAWRTMLRRNPSTLPKLVFAGKWGWKTSDLRDQIRDSDGLSGAVKVLDNVTDKELGAVYRSALFTLFPSLYEGWGLPVRESHAYGKVCVAASNSSITEAGGDLAVYFANDCQQALIEAVQPLIADPKLRRAREARIEAEFRPVGWDDSWQDLVAAILSRESGG